MTVRPWVWSYSRLNTYLRCPRSYSLSYADQASLRLALPFASQLAYARFAEDYWKHCTETRQSADPEWAWLHARHHPEDVRTLCLQFVESVRVPTPESSITAFRSSADSAGEERSGLTPAEGHSVHEFARRYAMRCIDNGIARDVAWGRSNAISHPATVRDLCLKFVEQAHFPPILSEGSAIGVEYGFDVLLPGGLGNLMGFVDLVQWNPRGAELVIMEYKSSAGPSRRPSECGPQLESYGWALLQIFSEAERVALVQHHIASGRAFGWYHHRGGLYPEWAVSVAQRILADIEYIPNPSPNCVWCEHACDEQWDEHAVSLRGANPQTKASQVAPSTQDCGPDHSTDRWRAGQKVRHAKFGDGMVVSAEPLEDDWKLTVAFKNGGRIRKLLAGGAGLERL